LIAAISALNPGAAAALVRALGAEDLDVAADAAVASSDSALLAAAESHALRAADATLLKLADDVDAAPRRIRSGALELLKRMRASNLSIEALQQHLERQVAGGSRTEAQVHFRLLRKILEVSGTSRTNQCA
jgi:hypothetical protein